MKTKDTVLYKLHSGKKVKVVIRAISKLTGSLTIELLESDGCYKAGDRLNVNQWEVETNN